MIATAILAMSTLFAQATTAPTAAKSTAKAKSSKTKKDSQTDHDHNSGSCRKVVTSRKGSIGCLHRERRASGALVIWSASVKAYTVHNAFPSED